MRKYISEFYEEKVNKEELEKEEKIHFSHHKQQNYTFLDDLYILKSR